VCSGNDHYPGTAARRGAVLTGIVKATAADPDRAERIANTIPDEYQKAVALARIAATAVRPQLSELPITSDNPPSSCILPSALSLNPPAN
jgi:hypothetical protein